jgi:hypothetical protein
MNWNEWVFQVVASGIGSASWLEITWTLAGIFGLAFVVRSARYTAAQARRVRAKADFRPDGPRAELIDLYQDRERVWVITFGGIIGLGGIFMLIPPPTQVPNAIGGGIFALALLAYVWFLARAVQRELRHRLRVDRLVNVPEKKEKLP